MAAPACLVGQDNPITDAAINTKTIQFEMDGKKIEGGLFDPAAPFPVMEWAQWLMSRWDKEKAGKRLMGYKEVLQGRLVHDPSDTNVGRFVENYAALLFAIEELLAFAGYQHPKIWGTVIDLMNHHLNNTITIRRESVAILDRLAREITLAVRPEDRPPYKIQHGQLIIPPAVILDYLNKRGHHYPVTSSWRLVEHLKFDGFLVERNRSRNINKHKYKCVVLSLEKMEKAGIDWPEEADMVAP